MSLALSSAAPTLEDARRAAEAVAGAGASRVLLYGSLARGQQAPGGDIDFLPFSDLEQSVRDDVATIQSCEHIDSSIPVRGFIYDVDTGRLNEVN